MSLPVLNTFCGKSLSGKTYAMNRAVKEFIDSIDPEVGGWIISVTSASHDPDEDLMDMLGDKKLMTRKKIRAFVFAANSVDKQVTAHIKDLLASKRPVWKPSLLIIDDLTYSLSKEFVSLLTFLRHFSCCALLCLHSMRGGPVFSRLREFQNTLTLFQVTQKGSLLELLPDNTEHLIPTKQYWKLYVDFKNEAVCPPKLCSPDEWPTYFTKELLSNHVSTKRRKVEAEKARVEREKKEEMKNGLALAAGGGPLPFGLQRSFAGRAGAGGGFDSRGGADGLLSSSVILLDGSSHPQPVSSGISGGGGGHDRHRIEAFVEEERQKKHEYNQKQGGGCGRKKRDNRLRRPANDIFRRRREGFG